MILTIKPYGAISEALIQNKYIDNDKYFVIDDLYNRIEITKEDYDKLECPYRKPTKVRNI